MGEMSRARRARNYRENTATLRELVKLFDLEVWEFSISHLRIVGRQSVDYWPTTGRAWIMGSEGCAVKATPAEACGLAMSIAAERAA